MSMEPQFLELLRCPVSRQRLMPAPAELVAELEARRRAGTLSVPDATPQWNPSEPIEAVLVREDGQIGYPVQGQIPILLPGNGFELTAATLAAELHPPSA